MRTAAVASSARQVHQQSLLQMRNNIGAPPGSLLTPPNFNEISSRPTAMPVTAAKKETDMSSGSSISAIRRRARRHGRKVQKDATRKAPLLIVAGLAVLVIGAFLSFRGNRDMIKAGYAGTSSVAQRYTESEFNPKPAPGVMLFLLMDNSGSSKGIKKMLMEESLTVNQALGEACQEPVATTVIRYADNSELVADNIVKESDLRPLLEKAYVQVPVSNKPGTQLVLALERARETFLGYQKKFPNAIAVVSIASDGGTEDKPADLLRESRVWSRNRCLFYTHGILVQQGMRLRESVRNSMKPLRDRNKLVDGSEFDFQTSLKQFQDGLSTLFQNSPNFQVAASPENPSSHPRSGQSRRPRTSWLPGSDDPAQQSSSLTGIRSSDRRYL